MPCHTTASANHDAACAEPLLHLFLPLFLPPRYLKLCSSREELARLPQGPKVVLATSPTLEAGFSRQLFVEWAGDPRNAILLVLPPEDGTLAATMAQQAGSGGGGQAQQLGGQQLGEVPSVKVTLSRRVPLEGEELQEYLEQQRQQLEAQEGAEEQQAGAGGMEVEGAGEVAGASPRSVGQSAAWAGFGGGGCAAAASLLLPADVAGLVLLAVAARSPLLVFATVSWLDGWPIEPTGWPQKNSISC